ncbi:MAG: hypothetical protein ACRDWI_02130 [Jiangellaceae bacterium]
MDKTNYYGASVSHDGHWLIVTSSQGTAPRNDLWLADLTTADAAMPQLRPVQVRGGPGATGSRALAGPAGRGPEAVLEDFAVLDDLDRPILVASWTRHAISELSVHDTAGGERLGMIDLPGLGSVGGLSERPEGGHEAWFSYTDHTTPVRVLQLRRPHGRRSHLGGQSGHR